MTNLVNFLDKIKESESGTSLWPNKFIVFVPFFICFGVVDADKTTAKKRSTNKTRNMKKI